MMIVILIKPESEDYKLLGVFGNERLANRAIANIEGNTLAHFIEGEYEGDEAIYKRCEVEINQIYNG